MSTLSALQRIEPQPRVRTIRVGLAGCGVVGGSLLALLREHGAAIERTRGVRIEPVRVLVRDAQRARPVQLAPHVVTTDVESFLATPVDVIVEALGGREPAERIAWAALGSGRDFITANKALVAGCGVELQELARRNRARFSFEASVAGGVPVLRVLRDALVGADVRAVRGVLNGTTNFILSRMHEGSAFAAALAEAQTLGFAEADPARDLDGRDAADKVAILAWLAFGADPGMLLVHRTGLLPDPDLLVGAARACGAAVRLLGECVRLPHGTAAAVEPVLVSAQSRFAAVCGADNLVEVETGWSGTLRFAGAGAGGAPTASALLGDLLTAPAPLPAHAAGAHPRQEDPRALQWVLSARAADGERLADNLAAAGVTVSEVHTDARTWQRHVLTAPVSRTDIDVAQRTLHARGSRCVRSRYTLTNAHAF